MKVRLLGLGVKGSSLQPYQKSKAHCQVTGIQRLNLLQPVDMAADTREPSRHADASQPSIFRKLDKNVSSVPESSTSTATGRPYRGETYETFASSPTPRSEEASLTSSKSIELGPPENANVLPGGSVNTAGGRAKEATFWDGIKSIKMQDVKDLHKIPCVRDALLVGIGGGFFIGGGRMVSGGRSSFRATPYLHAPIHYEY